MYANYLIFLNQLVRILLTTLLVNILKGSVNRLEYYRRKN